MNPVIANAPELAPFSVPKDGSEDGRRFARRPCKLHAHLTIQESLDKSFDIAREFDVIVRNISRSGVCFLFVRQMFPDDLVQLDFGGLVRRYRVARCRRIGDNCYEIGLAICN
ncbi:PilZ domain-containing protein [Anatilimnocola floriformis]|uniref:PilZ domain-containing protein n=1 Tax=Anatilimnocola floriformis TaxID=2948575 RepID=UPI0020C40872|nr:PilZ domain-containing protein [Anatilimnocola floriformis]